MGKETKHSNGREIWAVVLVGMALLLLLSLISYDPYDVGNAAASGQRTTSNFVGPVGAWLSFISFQTIGLSGYALMFVLAWLGGMLLLGREIPWRSKAGAGALLLVSLAVLVHMWGLEVMRRKLNLPSAGGFVGLFVGDLFQRFLGRVGTAVIFVVFYLISLIVLINLRPSYWVVLGVGAAQDLWARLRGKPRRDMREELTEQKRDLRYREYKLEREAAKLERELPPEPKIEDRTGGAPKPDDKPSVVQKIADKVIAKKERPPELVLTGTAKPKPRPEKPVLAEPSVPLGPFTLPPVDLLEKPPAIAQRNVIEDLKASAEVLRATLEEFGINVQVSNVTKGPVVTLYELVPAPGLKVEKITALSNNIALAMKAVSIRILTPVPGKGTVGIEVPNSTTTTVYLRDILESEEWRATKARVPVALGRDVGGNIILADLADMPHLLIAGATGSGKTVCVNAILASLLFRFTPEELRLVLIDPKVVEMQQLNVLPHLVVPVVTEAKKVPLALRWVIHEMEKRFQIFAKVGVRNIAGFNSRVRQKLPVPTEATEDLKIEVPRDDELVIPDKLPYIVVVIDELADLMLVSPKDVESAIARLAQLSRAVGIHMVLATQRPSVNVVTGVIKANFPARIAFQVASKQDSRVILDANGADKLLGKGDMLYLPPGSAKLVRAQGVLVLDHEIKRMVDFIAAQGKPRFVAEIHEKLQKVTARPSGDMGDEEADEELVEQCVEIIRQTNRASVSILQRRLRIGYTRAARIMDLLEERGIVGPNKGAEPRDILMDLNDKQPTES